MKFSVDPNLSGGQRRNAKDQIGDAPSRPERPPPPSIQHRADPAGTPIHHRFVGGMRSSIEEEDESLEL